jgi:SAM-dependent methyltransferase
MLNKLKEKYSKEFIYPTYLSLLINPFYFSRKGLLQNILPLAKNITGKTLDVGCGGKPYEQLCNSSEYIGLEFDSPENRANKKADSFYNGKDFPFIENEFDSVITTQVLEHVADQTRFFKEINRVLKIDGKLLLTVPFIYNEHEQPNDYVRYSSFGLKAEIENYGFEIIEFRKSISDIRVLFQLLNDYISKKILVKNGYLNLLLILLFIAPFNIIGELLGIVLPGDNDLYLDNIVLAKKKFDYLE